MNSQLRKYFRIGLRDDLQVKNLEARNIKQYVFQTKKHIDK